MKKTLISIIVIASSLSVTAAPFKAYWGRTDNKITSDCNTYPSYKEAFDFPAWKGEKVNAQALIYAEEDITGAALTVSNLICGKNVIPASAVKASFLENVMADYLSEGFGQCHQRFKGQEDSLLVADIIGFAASKDIAKGQYQGVWLSIKVPSATVPGTYKGSLTVNAAEGAAVLPITLKVADHLMSEPADWAFHLDLWQNPWAVARYHNVTPWSKEHFDYMRPVMKILADAGQKVITTTIIDRPWNGQTQDAFGTMVTKVRKADGTWMYDYTIFDMWVEFMMSVGIDEQINCYSLIPWKLTFDYYDQATGKIAYVNAGPQEMEYKVYWSNFIKDFCKHLREKGWFDKTMIAMDERGKEAMEAAMELLSIEPDLKINLAGNFNEEIQSDIDDLCITSQQEYPAEARAKRREEGKISTFYTCCAERFPNTFVVSPAAEASWIGWYAFAKDLDGYLRWAYNSWTIDPLADARFVTWTAGDCFIIYPEGRSSTRMEKLIEGVRDFEKARMVRAEWEKAGNTKALKKLDEATARFNFEDLSENGAAPAVNQARKVIASF